MRYLLDTCVISELVARQPDPDVLSWIDSVDEEKLYLSAITIGEIKKGIEKLSGSARRDTLAEWLEGDLLILEVDPIPLLKHDNITLVEWPLDTAEQSLANQELVRLSTLLGFRLGDATKPKKEKH